MLRSDCEGSIIFIVEGDMRVLIINSVCGIRSTGRICAEIATKYIELGHEVRIAYGRESVPDKYKYIALPIGGKCDAYVNIYVIKIHGGNKNGLFEVT